MFSSLSRSTVVSMFSVCANYAVILSLVAVLIFTMYEDNTILNGVYADLTQARIQLARQKARAEYMSSEVDNLIVENNELNNELDSLTAQVSSLKHTVVIEHPADYIVVKSAGGYRGVTKVVHKKSAIEELSDNLRYNAMHGWLWLTGK